MAETDASYQDKVGKERGADRFFIREDGEFKFFDMDLTGRFLRNFVSGYTRAFGIADETTLALLNTGAISMGDVLSTITDIPSASPTGALGFDISTGGSLYSMSMPPLSTKYSGCVLLLNGASIVGDGNLVLKAYNVSIVGANKATDLSSINLSANCIIEFISDGVKWQVMQRNASATEQPSS